MLFHLQSKRFFKSLRTLQRRDRIDVIERPVGDDLDNQGKDQGQAAGVEIAREMKLGLQENAGQLQNNTQGLSKGKAQGNADRNAHDCEDPGLPVDIGMHLPVLEADLFQGLGRIQMVLTDLDGKLYIFQSREIGNKIIELENEAHIGTAVGNQLSLIQRTRRRIFQKDFR